MSKDTVTVSIEEFLRHKGIDATEKLMKTLGELGVKEISHLSLLEEKDFREAGLNAVESKLLIRAIYPEQLPLRQMTSMPTFTPTLMTPLPTQHHYDQPLEPSIKSKPSFKVGYILCRDLFMQTQEVSYVTVNPEQDSMEFLIKQICEIHLINEGVLTLELFSQKGYALNVNIYTMKLTLDQWRIHNDDTFYAFVRRKEQPAWTYDELNNSDLLDPKKGKQILKIISEIFGILTINVDLCGLKVNTILKKVAQCIGIPPQYLELYKSVHEHCSIDDEDIGDVHDGDTLILRLKSVHNVLSNYGKPSYIPYHEQTDKGLAKFYSILRYLTIGINFDHRSIVGVVLKLTECPPLATALHLLFHNRTISHISYLTALVEGFYFLSRAVLEYFCDNVKLDQTFEFSDYIFGRIIKISNTTSSDEFINFKTIRLTCPITTQKILQPVCVQNQFFYEYIAAKEMITNKEALPECDNEDDIVEEDLVPDDQMEHYLLASAFSPATEVHFFEPKCCSKLKIPQIFITWEWRELKENISLLKVMSPDTANLGSLVKSLTYIAKGQVVVATSIKKDNELSIVIYNSLTCKDEDYTHDKMKEFVCSDENISHNIADFLHAKAKTMLSDQSLTLPSVVRQTQDGYEITKEPKEAIMVLLDTSSSMNSPIFNDQDPKYKKITAACNFFAAFATRTEAYEFDHVIGAICFNTEIKEVLPLCENWLKFKSILDSSNVKVFSETALYDALKKGAEVLSKFGLKYPQCQKRILCLTDGDDNRSKTTAFEAATLLRSKDVIVDSVLITGPKGNNAQKAICHATGGWCFLPTTCREGTRLFEMEVLLSVGHRNKVTKPNVTTQADFRRLESGSYNSTDPYSFKSIFFMELDETTTCSVKRMVLLASFVSGEQSSSSAQKPHVKHILQEMRKYQKNPHEHFAIFPDESNICHWKILLRGDESTPYGGIYLLFAKFPDNYPYKPLEIRFVTPIYHCNINSIGRICHPILGRNYIPSLTIREIFDQIFGLLMAPEPDDPLDSVLAEEFHTNRDEYMRKARQLDREKARQISWEDYMKVLTEETADVDDELKCPLTGKLFEDPVSTPYGHTYERSALLEYMKRNGNLDPKAKKPLRRDQLSSPKVIKALVEKFRKANLLN